MDGIAVQESIVSDFAALLGAQSQGSQSTNSGITTASGVTSSATQNDFYQLLSKAALSTDIVATLPSMEMTMEAAPLPSVGESFRQPETPKPHMAASVLNSSSNGDTGNNQEKASTKEREAAKTLGNLTSWTKSTLSFLPLAASKNVAASFTSLVQARVKAWTLLLLRHSLTTGDAASRSRLLSMLSSKIELYSAETSFKTLPLPASARLHAKESDVILPLLFEATLSVSVQGRNDTVFLRAPGTVAGNLNKGIERGLMKVDVRLDTDVMLESMVEQARLIVFKSVARATSTNTDRLHATKTTSANTTDNNSNDRTLSSFSSALNLSATEASRSPKLQKARSSALRLNSILQGKGNNNSSSANNLAAPMQSKIRKNRSVQWDSDVPARESQPPAAKRQRLVQSSAKLRSFKSFGRPHGGDDGGDSSEKTRNATFGDFGRHTVAIWGRDGRLRNHPKPGNALASSRLSNLVLDSSQEESSNQNAIFDVPTSRGLSRGLASSNQMKRTATNLENWLMHNATPGRR